MLTDARSPSTRYFPSAAPRLRARPVYAGLLREQGSAFGTVDELTRAASRSFLLDRISAVAGIECDFPGQLRALPGWLERQNREAAEAYRAYLDERRAGGPRRFFTQRSHALQFLRAVAPTKLVDGAWLYGLLRHADDPRFGGLIRIYLDELGGGRASQNHVVLYRELLARQGLDGGEPLSDDHYTQGAIQLALAHHADEFLPELIGFNLGYEQLPLHLPITAYELAELGIDPYYFTLHVTVDNPSTGHARQALDAVRAAWPTLGDGAAFLARIAAGYKLNLIGMGTTEAIESFDIDAAVHAMLASKASLGAALHSDRCRLAGRTVSEWLSEPERLPEFLRVLQDKGWIKRGEPPDASRFWRLLHDEGQPMFGAFNAAEQCLLADWIGGSPEPTRRFVGRATSAANTSPASLSLSPDATVAEIVDYHLAGFSGTSGGDFDTERRLLAERLAGVSDRQEALALLSGLLSPANHPTTAGLLATQLFAQLLDARG